MLSLAVKVVKAFFSIVPVGPCCDYADVDVCNGRLLRRRPQID